MTKTTTSQVVADIKSRTGLVAERRTRRDYRPGFTVRKHNAAVVGVFTSAHEGWEAEWEQILSALEDAGYSFARLSGERGEAAKAASRLSGAVLCYRKG